VGFIAAVTSELSMNSALRLPAGVELWIYGHPPRCVPWVLRGAAGSCGTASTPAGSFPTTSARPRAHSRRRRSRPSSSRHDKLTGRLRRGDDRRRRYCYRANRLRHHLRSV